MKFEEMASIVAPSGQKLVDIGRSTAKYAMKFMIIDV